MKKVIFILILFLSISTTSFSNSRNYEKLNTEMVMKDLDTIKSQIDSTFRVGKKIVNLMNKEVKTYGIKKTIQINMKLLLPLFIFLALYSFWLKNRKK
jgi:hypothetical protein